MIANGQALGCGLVTFSLLLAGCGFESSHAKGEPTLAATANDYAGPYVRSEAATTADVEGPLEILPDLGS